MSLFALAFLSRMKAQADKLLSAFLISKKSIFLILYILFRRLLLVFMNLQVGDDEDRMEVALLHRRDGHIILVDVLEILIGVVWCREVGILEAYLAQGKHGGAVVGDAIAVHRRNVGIAC